MPVRNRTHRQALDRHSDETRRMTAQINDLTRQRDDAREGVRVAKTSYAKAESDANRLKRERDQARSELRLAEAALAQAQDDLTAAHAEAEGLREKIAELTAAAPIAATTAAAENGSDGPRTPVKPRTAPKARTGEPVIRAARSGRSSAAKPAAQ